MGRIRNLQDGPLDPFVAVIDSSNENMTRAQKFIMKSLKYPSVYRSSGLNEKFRQVIINADELSMKSQFDRGTRMDNVPAFVNTPDPHDLVMINGVQRLVGVVVQKAQEEDTDRMFLDLLRKDPELKRTLVEIPPNSAMTVKQGARDRAMQTSFDEERFRQTVVEQAEQSYRVISDDSKGLYYPGGSRSRFLGPTMPELEPGEVPYSGECVETSRELKARLSNPKRNLEVKVEQLHQFLVGNNVGIKAYHHDFLIVTLEDSGTVWLVDPTWQQFVDERHRIPSQPVLIIKIESTGHPYQSTDIADFLRKANISDAWSQVIWLNRIAAYLNERHEQAMTAHSDSMLKDIEEAFKRATTSNNKYHFFAETDESSGVRAVHVSLVRNSDGRASGDVFSVTADGHITVDLEKAVFEYEILGEDKIEVVHDGPEESLKGEKIGKDIYRIYAEAVPLGFESESVVTNKESRRFLFEHCKIIDLPGQAKIVMFDGKTVMDKEPGDQKKEISVNDVLARTFIGYLHGLAWGNFQILNGKARGVQALIKVIEEEKNSEELGLTTAFTLTAVRMNRQAPGDDTQYSAGFKGEGNQAMKSQDLISRQEQELLRVSAVRLRDSLPQGSFWRQHWARAAEALLSRPREMIMILLRMKIIILILSMPGKKF